MIACLVFSASGPNTRTPGTTRSLSCETGAPQNGRKHPPRNRTPRDDDLAQALLDTVQAQGDMFRQHQGFAAIVLVPGDASIFDPALSRSGRDPNWPGNDRAA
jgi:hypothetical protein